MTLLAIATIRLDGGTQPRVAIDRDVVTDYSRQMAQGAKFPPLDVFYDGSEYWLADGFHRIGAARDSGLATIECEIRQGSREDAQWFSFSVNHGHGLRRTNEDKQRTVKAALMHPQSVKKSDHAIAKHCGVAVSTVSEWRRKIEVSIGIEQIPERTVTRNGTTYQQNTANIGKRTEPTVPCAVAEPPERVAAAAPPSPEIPKGKRQTQLENAELRRMTDGLSTVRGICRALKDIDTAKIAGACPGMGKIKSRPCYARPLKFEAPHKLFMDCNYPRRSA